MTQVVIPRTYFGLGMGAVLTPATTNELVIPFVGVVKQGGGSPAPPATPNQVQVMCVM